MTCRPDGTWSDSLCLASSCPSPPDVPLAVDTMHCAGTASGNECRITCLDGLSANPYDSTTCQAGSWVPPVACLPNACGPATCEPLGSCGAASCAGTPSGHECHYSCRMGFVAAATPVITCSSGHWSSPATCLPEPCQSTDNCPATSSGDNCTVQCPPGHNPVPLVVTCKHGAFVPWPACSPLPCSGRWSRLARRVLAWTPPWRSSRPSRPSPMPWCGRASRRRGAALCLLALALAARCAS